MRASRGRAERVATSIAAAVFFSSVFAQAEGTAAPHTPQSAAAKGPGDPILVVRALVSWGFRDLHYNDSLNDFRKTAPVLPTYALDHGAGAGIEAGVYPFASSDSRTVQVGAVLSFRKEALLAQSHVGDQPLDASSSQWQAGLRMQIPVGPHELGLSAGLGAHTFSLSDASRNPRPVPVPNVAWSYGRFGVDGRLNVAPLFVGAEFGYRAPYGSGQIGSYDWFPRLTVSGFDATIFAGAPLSDNVELALGYEIRRYAFAAHPKVGDSVVAGGAVDLYGSGWLALGLRF